MGQGRGLSQAHIRAKAVISCVTVELTDPQQRKLGLVLGAGGGVLLLRHDSVINGTCFHCITSTDWRFPRNKLHAFFFANKRTCRLQMKS